MTTETASDGVTLLATRIEAANAHVLAGRTAEAIEAFTEIARRWPNVPEVPAVLCDLYLSEGRTDFDPTWIGSAIAHDPSFVETFHGVAGRLYAQGRHDDARAILESLTAALPDHSGLLNELGVVRYCTKDLTGAEEALRRALELEPGHVEALKTLAHLLIGTDRADEARRVCAGSPEILADMESAIDALRTDPAGPTPSVPSIENVTGIEIRYRPGNPDGPQRRFALEIDAPGSRSEYVLSVDIYPEDAPSHPARHHGYWNHPVTVGGGETTRVELSWDPASRAVTFDGEAATDAWQGPLAEDGNYVLTFLLYRGETPVAKQHARQRIGAPRLASAIWFMTWKCNMKCKYCWEVQRIEKGELKPDPFKDGLVWADAWNRLRPGTLDLSGGEPFLQPGFIDMLEAFDDSIKVAITSNMTHDLTEFVRRISPEKVFSMTLSLHPTQKLPFEHFIGRALLLKNRGFNITINYVTWPEQMWLIPEYKKRIEDYGIRFHVDPYAPTPHFPFTFSEKERAFLREYVGDDRKAHWFGEIDKTPVMCSGGLDHINVEPNGDAYRCIGDRLWGKPKVGNILEPDFTLSAKSSFCEDYWRCPSCDKDKVTVEKLSAK